MTYQELSYTLDLLREKGYMEQKQPIWDMDMYQILNEVNKNLKEEN